LKKKKKKKKKKNPRGFKTFKVSKKPPPPGLDIGFGINSPVPTTKALEKKSSKKRPESKPQSGGDGPPAVKNVAPFQMQSLGR